MTDYTLVNLKDDVEDAAVRLGLSPDLEARFGRGALGLGAGGFSYQKFAANVVSSTGHRHRLQEEVYVVLAGSGRVKLDNEERDERQWDVLRVAPSVARGFASGPDGLELLAIGFGEGGDAEMVDGIWGGEGS
jgi:mannose-6-phosphate isomerase-like protein (cupin superfamily)